MTVSPTAEAGADVAAAATIPLQGAAEAVILRTMPIPEAPQLFLSTDALFGKGEKMNGDLALPR